MTAALIYAALALLLVVGAAVFLRSDRRRAIETSEEASEHIQGLWEPEGLSVAERIFDPADYGWLRDEVGFPRLAESLRWSRQRMALDWLSAIRKSFDDLLKTPEPQAAASGQAAREESWSLVVQTLRFHLVLGYAYFVVRFFGPYHRLVPSFRWMRPVSTGSPARESYGSVHSGRFS